MRLPGLSDARRASSALAARLVARYRDLRLKLGRHLVPALIVLVLMGVSLTLFIALRGRSGGPASFGVPDDFGILAMTTSIHARSPLAPGVEAWKQGYPWKALDLFLQAATQKLTLEEQLAILNYSGHVRLSIGDLAQAAAAFRAANAVEKNAGSLYGLGRVEQLAGKPAAAREQYREAVALRKDFALAWRRSADCAALTGDHAGALTEYRKALALGEDQLVRYRIGETQLALGEIETARREFQTVFENAQNRNLIGYAAARLGDIASGQGAYTKALESYQQAVGSCPDEPAFRYNLSLLYIRAGRLDDALGLFQGLRGGKQDKVYGQSLSRILGELYYDRNDHEAALRYFSEADATDPEIMAMLGDLHYLRGDHEEALAAYARVLEKLPRSRFALVAHVNSGTIWLGRGQPARALAAYRRGQRLDPGNAAISCNIALALLANNERTAAVDEFRRAWKADPTLSVAMDAIAAILRPGPASEIVGEAFDADTGDRHHLAGILGRLALLLRENARAARWFTTAAGLASGPQARALDELWLARASLAREDFPAAAKLLAGTSSLLGSDPRWLYQSAMLAVRTGRDDDARHYLETALNLVRGKSLKAACLYWFGNLEWRDGAYARALGRWREVLELQPDHTAAAFNAALTVKLLANDRTGGRGRDKSAR